LAERVLILGGYGVFGGRLARRLTRESDAEVLVAGRSLKSAEAHCQKFGGTPVQLDRDNGLDEALARLGPVIVVDATGPFQNYGTGRYRVAEVALATGAHYVDLADDAAFVAGIAELDGAARAAGVSVLSGASSVPAISSAALDELVKPLVSVSRVGSAILPGNRAPRGLSVVRAIVAQVGRPLAVWRGGRWTSEPAWGRIGRLTLTVDGAAPLSARLASSIGAPDHLLFPERYRVRSAQFQAGLEMKIMHVGLWLLSWPVRLGFVRSIGGLAGILKWIADRLEPFGSDRGGMLVCAAGRDRDGRAVERSWTIIAEAGDGPEIPPTPAFLLVKRLLSGKSGIVPGATPAIGVLGLAEIEAALAPFAIRCEQQEKMVPPLMERALAEDFSHLPAAWKRLAEIHDIDNFAGDASVERGQGLASRLVGSLFGFPPATNAVTVEVTKQKTAKGEQWIRRFGDRSFVSHLSLRHDDAPGMLRERFGPLSFALRLRAENGKVHWPVEKWTALGVPMPLWLMPKSETVEFVDGDGRFNFDVAITVPLVGRVVRYRGWLKPVNDCLSQTCGIVGSPDFSPTAATDPPPLQTGRRFTSAKSQTE
jgi:hypothetical protein